MYPYIVCTCGRSIGDLFDAFKAIKMKKYDELYKNSVHRPDPALLAISEFIPSEMGIELDSIHLFLDCCRIKMVSQVEFKDLY